MAKLLEAQIHEETKLWSLIVLCLSRSKYARKEQQREEKQSEEEDSICSLLLHFWSTSRSPFSTCYIPFQSSGSEESNASNRVWSWNEEDMAFGRQLHQAEGQFRTLRNWNFNVWNLKWMVAVHSLWSPTCKSDFSTCELGSQRAKVDSKLRNFRKSPCNVRNWDFCAPTLFLLIFCV